LKRFYESNFFGKIVFKVELSYLSSAGLFMEKTVRDSLWNSYQPSSKGISSEVFRQYFAPLELEDNQSNKFFIQNLED